MAGQHSADELERKLVAIETVLAHQRREDLGLVLNKLEALRVIVQEELRLDGAELERVQERYRQQFGVLARLNPWNRERKAAHGAEVEPLEDEVGRDRQVARRCLALLEATRAAAAPIEVRERWHGGVFGVYRPDTGQVEWRDSWNHGLCGVWNPLVGQVEWKQRWHGGVYGVWNPVLQAVEWKESWHHGVCGVWDPVRRQVAWRERWHGGVAGVWNPLRQEIEWKDSWHHGVAGAWDAELRQVVWHQRWNGGICAVYRSAEGYASCGSYHHDDDD